MLNREKYANEIIDIAARSRLALKNGRPVQCWDTPCAECDFHCSSGCATETVCWLNAEYAEPSVDWSKVAVDTPILVRNSEKAAWKKRHFAKYENGIVYSWSGGTTHWSVHRSSNISAWEMAKLAESEEKND